MVEIRFLNLESEENGPNDWKFIAGIPAPLHVCRECRIEGVALVSQLKMPVFVHKSLCTQGINEKNISVPVERLF